LILLQGCVPSLGSTMRRRFTQRPGEDARERRWVCCALGRAQDRHDRR
jgi:hypothetical protein